MTSHSDPEPSQESIARQQELLAGRETERAVIHGVIEQAMSGRGSVVLIGGQAGIGKTTLVREATAFATNSGYVSLIGSCYDLGYTSPLGPWQELFASWRRRLELPAPPASFRSGQSDGFPDQLTLFTEVRAALEEAAARWPILLVFEDMHWSDQESLDLLRGLATQVQYLPIVLLVTFRADEIDPTTPFHQRLPQLVRESEALRIDLRPLDRAGLTQLVSARYSLPPDSLADVVDYLERFAEGNPFYAVELLRELEAERVLTNDNGNWEAGDLRRVMIPTLIRQIVEYRIERLGEPASKALAVAAVIGQEVSLILWMRIAGVEEQIGLDIIEQATKASLISPTSDGRGFVFAHALIRESLYESISPPRRRVMHKLVAETMLDSAECAADTVAFHFERAGDHRAWDWLVEAGHQAQKAYAWQTAVDRFRSALALPLESDDQCCDRGWLTLRLARLRRMSDPGTAIAMLQSAADLAARCEDLRLIEEIRHVRGVMLCYSDRMSDGIKAITASASALSAMSDAERYLAPEHEVAIADALAEHHPINIADDQRATAALEAVGLNSRHGPLPWFLAASGRSAEALEAAVTFRSAVEDIPRARGLSQSATGFALHGEAIALAAKGKFEEARSVFAECREVFAEIDHHALITFVLLSELNDVAFTWYAAEPAYRHELAELAVDVFDRAGGAMQTGVGSTMVQMRSKVLDGAWNEVNHSLSGLPEVHHAYLRREVSSATAYLGLHQGNPERAWKAIYSRLPLGPDTPPGNTIHQEGLYLQRISVELALDADDAPTTLRWLDAHDRWIQWGQGILGQAEGMLLRGRHLQRIGQHQGALELVQSVLSMMPPEPLAELQANNLAGELLGVAGDLPAAAHHLTAAEELAVRCGVPYEHARVLMNRAEVLQRQGNTEDAIVALDQAKSLASALQAAPLLQRIDTIRGLHGRPSSQRTRHPLLSSREIDVLRLLGEHLTNKEIADRLFISHRTVQTHVEHICAKLGVENRRQAAHRGIELGLI